MELNNSLRKRPVAVVGMSAIFADARNLEEFWNNIIEGKDSISDVPENRWRIEDYYDPDPSTPDKTYCKRGGFIPDIDFDPMEFGLPPNILEVTDASQLLALIAARDAFEHAGYGKKSEKFTKALKERTGVLLGVGGGQKLITPLTSRLQFPIWERALRASGIHEEDIPNIVDKIKKAYIGWNENSFPGMLGNVISGRITNRFDLGGINSVVDAACAASLSAVKMALSELVEGRADMMLTGGVDTDNSPFMFMSFSKTPAFSKKNVISPFSDEADGMLIGEGLGMVVLKRLEDAERDGDTIYAVIKGVGTSSDGRYKSVYAPRPEGQALAMNRAYEEAGYSAASVGLIEAHGTGTNAGDACELRSMNMVFGANNTTKNHIALGSVKSQVGHTKAAAGAAGLLKSVLALHHQVLPPTLNVKQPNSSFDFKDSPLYINTTTRPWLTNSPRRAAVSAFGFGGINVHITLEEYTKATKKFRIHQPTKSILISAADKDSLKRKCIDFKKGLEAENATYVFWQNYSQSEMNPSEHTCRVGFVCKDIDEAHKQLELILKQIDSDKTYWELPSGIYYSNDGLHANKKSAALFSGQGAQYVGMGAKLSCSYPEFKDALIMMDNHADTSLSQVVYPQPVFDQESKQKAQHLITQTEYAQPAIGAMSMGLYKILKSAGFEPDFVAGHSFGELTALWAADVIDDETYCILANGRGKAMSSTQANQKDTGSMLAVKANVDTINQYISFSEDVKIANINSDQQTILGGSTSAILSAADKLQEQGIKSVKLNVSAAFHTEFVEHAQKPFASLVDDCTFKSSSTPILSNTTSNVYPSEIEQIKDMLKAQMLKPVLFKDQIINLYNAGVRSFIEIGPKSILSNLVSEILKTKDIQVISMNASPNKDDERQFRASMLKLSVLGFKMKHFDHSKAPYFEYSKRGKMSIPMGGHNYVSKPTQKLYYDALNDGKYIKNQEIKIVEKQVEVIKEIEKIVEVPTNNISSNITNEDEMNQQILDTLKQTVEHITQNQNKSLEIFKNFLNEQQSQTKQLIQLLTQSIDTSTSESPISKQIQTEEIISRTAETNDSTKDSTKTSNGVENFKQAESNHAVEVLASPNEIKIKTILLKVISEKTGYPVEMLELDMDMEADLGIDSIKRVEIFGSMTEDHPEMSGVNPNDLTELRTLGQIVDYLNGNMSSSDSNNQIKAEINQTTSEEKENSNTAERPDDKIKLILLEVISEKTGYPVEMLELDMDMEADLGIDSIKRVEIFGSMTEDHPEMSGVNPNDLTELRTLGQIVDYLNGKVSPSDSKNHDVSDMPQITTEISNEEVTVTELSDDKIKVILLGVISEKTGYPVEMLELDMDMEADLGIDSIKRVEIFGSMTEDHPEMSGVNPNDLTELRTLGQIVEYLNGKVSASDSNNQDVSDMPQITTEISNEEVAVTELSDDKIKLILLEVISEKTGYPVEMLELDMDMEADLGIDSIKRVEIFGSMTEDHPEMSGVNPNDLTELRTLGQIVEYLTSTSKKKAMN